MSKRLVSIIIPVYNVEQYIDRCIDSICRQTYKNIEIIIVNDGSTDNSSKILDAYADKDSRIRVLNKINGGLSSARNLGIKKCNGEYVFFVDGDDFIADNLIEHFLIVAEKTDADYVCSESFSFVDGDDDKTQKIINRMGHDSPRYRIVDRKEALLRLFYQKPSFTGAYLKLYRKNLFDNIEFPEARYFEDLATTYKFMQAANVIAFVKDKYYAYRIRSNSIMNQKFNERKMDCIWISKQMEQDFLYADESIKNAVFCSIFRINRIIYAQTPFQSDYSKNIYVYISKYRKSVIKNRNVNVYERILALMSYGGEGFFRSVLSTFSAIKKMKMRISVMRWG